MHGHKNARRIFPLAFKYSCGYIKRDKHETGHCNMQHVTICSEKDPRTRSPLLTSPLPASSLLLPLRAVHVTPSSATAPTKATRTSLMAERGKGKVKHSKHELVAGDNVAWCRCTNVD